MTEDVVVTSLSSSRSYLGEFEPDELFLEAVLVGPVVWTNKLGEGM
jgi:hypothetical protein